MYVWALARITHQNWNLSDFAAQSHMYVHSHCHSAQTIIEFQVRAIMAEPSDSSDTATFSSLSESAFPLFKLPTELRIAIYHHLQFPPVNNFECVGLILSCRQAKQEAEEAALKNTKSYLAHQKGHIRSEAPFNIEILITPPSSISSRFRFNTITEITILLPASEYHSIRFAQRKFFNALNLLNPIFVLWLSKLTLHFRRDEEVYRVANVASYPQKGFFQLLFFLYEGFAYGHDTTGTVKDRPKSDYKRYSDNWDTSPAFMRCLVISWDFTEHGLNRDDMVEMNGTARRKPTDDCGGPPGYRVMSDDEKIGEIEVRSANRFRYDERRAWHARPIEGHKKHCWCRPPSPYVRYAKGLPTMGEGCWI